MNKLFLLPVLCLLLAGCEHTRVVVETKKVYIYPPKVNCPDTPKVTKNPADFDYMESDVRDFILSLLAVQSECHSSAEIQDKFIDKMKEREKVEGATSITDEPIETPLSLNLSSQKYQGASLLTP